MSWIDRIVEFPNRVVLTPVSGETNTYDMTMAEGEIEESGTLLNAENLTTETNNLIDEKVNGAIYPSNFKAGKYTFSGTLKAGTTTSRKINFPVTFSKIPTVVCSVATSTPNKRSIGWASVTTTGFTVYVYTTSAVSNLTVSWVAMEV